MLPRYPGVFRSISCRPVAILEKRCADPLYTNRPNSLPRPGTHFPIARTPRGLLKRGGVGNQSAMDRHKEWQKVLDDEVRRWSAMSCRDLISKLHDGETYEVELDSKKYQVEVELLENREDYVQIIVAVDDGSLPASLFPLTQTFVRKKNLRPFSRSAEF